MLLLDRLFDALAQLLLQAKVDHVIPFLAILEPCVELPELVVLNVEGLRLGLQALKSDLTLPCLFADELFLLARFNSLGRAIT